MHYYIPLFICIAFIIFDYFNSTTSDQQLNVARFIAYGIFVNLISSKLIGMKESQELKRVIEERNLLQDLMLKDERISSQKIKRTIKKAQNINKKKRRKK